jgi:hypothetical protein
MDELNCSNKRPSKMGADLSIPQKIRITGKTRRRMRNVLAPVELVQHFCHSNVRPLVFLFLFLELLNPRLRELSKGPWLTKCTFALSGRRGEPGTENRIAQSSGLEALRHFKRIATSTNDIATSM